MDMVSTPSIIDDYFCLKEKVTDLESKNKKLEEKIQALEYVIVKKYKLEHKPSVTKQIFSYYERMKIISLVIMFFFGNKIFTDPLFYRCVKFLISRLVF